MTISGNRDLEQWISLVINPLDGLRIGTGIDARGGHSQRLHQKPGRTSARPHCLYLEYLLEIEHGTDRIGHVAWCSDQQPILAPVVLETGCAGKDLGARLSELLQDFQSW